MIEKINTNETEWINSHHKNIFYARLNTSEILFKIIRTKSLTNQILKYEIREKINHTKGSKKVRVKINKKSEGK
jgi:hypothetical protein